MKNLLMWGGIIFAVYYLVNNPVEGGNLLHGAVHLVEDVANSLSTAVNHVGGNQ